MLEKMGKIYENHSVMRIACLPEEGYTWYDFQEANRIGVLSYDQDDTTPCMPA